MIQVFHYPSVEERDKNKKEGGKLLGTADDPDEFVRLVNQALGEGAFNYFEGDKPLSFEEALKALGAFFDELCEEWRYQGHIV